jgi:O-antigen ligase
MRAPDILEQTGAGIAVSCCFSDKESASLTSIAQRLPANADLSGRLALNLDPFRAALALLIVINVSRIHQHYAVLAAFRPALALAAMALLYAFLNPKQVSLKGVLKTKAGRLILAMFGLACVSAPFGLSLGGSGVFVLESYSKVIVGAILLIAAIRSTRDLYTFVWAYVIGCGIISWLSIFVFGMSRSGSLTVRLHDLYTYDANDLGVVMMVGLGMTLLVLHIARGWAKIGAVVTLIGIGTTIARSGSRGALLGGIVTALAMLILLRSIPVWKRVAAILVTGLSLVLAAPPGYWDQMETMLTPKEDYNWTSSTGRKEVTKRGIGYMMKYPVFGLGINNFWRPECMDIRFERVQTHRAGTGIRCTPPHNSYVQAGAELGIPGLVLWLMLVFGGIGRMLKLRRRLPAAWEKGTREERLLFQAPQYFAVSMVGFAITSFFVSFAWIDIVYMLTAFMAGLEVAVQRRAAETGVAGVVPKPLRPGRRSPGYRSLAGRSR